MAAGSSKQDPLETTDLHCQDFLSELESRHSRVPYSTALDGEYCAAYRPSMLSCSPVIHAQIVEL